MTGPALTGLSTHSRTVRDRRSKSEASAVKESDRRISLLRQSTTRFPTSPRVACMITLLAIVGSIPSAATQDTHAERELSRLQTQAEDAMAQGDPQGAAIRIGRAALLASQLDNGEVPQKDQPPYRRMVDLFRTQEQVYRALALFQQSGEQTPVSSGICSLLSLGRHHAGRAMENDSLEAVDQAAHDHLHQQTTEWLDIVEELQQEWNCRQQESRITFSHKHAS